MQAVSEMPAEQFNRFCREYLHLMSFYNDYKLMWFTDESDFADAHPKYLQKPPELDYDQPIVFRRIL